MASQTIRCDGVQSATVSTSMENWVTGEPRINTFFPTQQVFAMQYFYSHDIGDDVYISEHQHQAFIRFSIPSEINGKRVESATLTLFAVENYSDTSTDYGVAVNTPEGSYFKVQVNPVSSDWTKATAAQMINSTAPFPIAETPFTEFSAGKEIKINLTLAGAHWQNSYCDSIFTHGVSLKYTSNYSPFGTNVRTHRRFLRCAAHDRLNPPYLTATVSDVTPTVTSITPTSGFIGIRKDFDFSWALDYDKTMVVGPLSQKAAKLRWRPAGTEGYTEYSIGSAATYRLQANTIGENVLAIQWQVLAQSSCGVWSEPSAWITLTTQDSSPNPVLVSPINQYLNIADNITFTWKHIITTGSTQTRFDLQYCRDSVTWLSFASELTARQSYTATAYTFPTGQIQWRVRTYNSANVASAWSAASIISIVGAPAAPTITSVSSASRPTVRWQCADQTSYELDALKGDDTIYATGEIVSTDKAHAITEYLDDGIYALRLRVRGQQAFSAWMTASFTVLVSKPKAPIVTVLIIAGGAKITAVADNTVTKMYLLRDGVPITKLSGSFIDYGCVGTHYYSVRAIGAADSFCDTREVEATVTLPSAVIAPTDNLSQMIPLKLRSGEPPTHSGGKTLIGGAQRCAGRQYPLYEFSEHTDEQYSLAFSFSHRADWQRLSELIERRKSILYRDQRNNAYYGVIVGATVTQGVAIDFILSVVRVDYVERLPYDPPLLT